VDDQLTTLEIDRSVICAGGPFHGDLLVSVQRIDLCGWFERDADIDIRLDSESHSRIQLWADQGEEAGPGNSLVRPNILGSAVPSTTGTLVLKLQRNVTGTVGVEHDRRHDSAPLLKGGAELQWRVFRSQAKPIDSCFCEKGGTDPGNMAGRI
jgi:hypothetical protein